MPDLTAKYYTGGRISVNYSNIEAGEKIILKEPKEELKKPDTEEHKDPATDDKQDDREARNL